MRGPLFSPGAADPNHDPAANPIEVEGLSAPTPTKRVGAHTDAEGLHPKIRTFGGAKRHEDKWNRSPNVTGTGAIHVRSFHSKLSDEGLGYVDQQINEWLDAHPQYEVKFVTTTVGEWTSKLGKEANLIVQVWV